MDTFRGDVVGGPTGRIAGLNPNLLMTVLVVLVIIILVIMLINMSSNGGSMNSSPGSPGTGGGTTFANPLNNVMRNNPVVTTTTRAV